MGMKSLNKKSLMQEGGEQQQSPANALVQQIGSMLESGAQPRAVVQGLLAQGIDEWDIKDAFMSLGMAPSDVDALFQSQEELQQETQQQLEEAAIQAEQELQNAQDQGYDRSESDTVGVGLAGGLQEESPGWFQYGGATALPSSINQYFGATENGYVKDPRANYLPMDLGTKGDLMGAAAFLGDATSDLFSKKIDPQTGLMSGFYRDREAKRARKKDPNTIGQYYSYKVTKDENDPNTYKDDYAGYYNAAKKGNLLRTKDQFEQDINTHSRIDYNTDKGRYEAIMSSREINPSTIGKNQRKEFDDFMGKSTRYGMFKDRFDSSPETKQMIIDSQKEGMASLGIDDKGQASSYMDAESNPYLYETMMGLNTLNSQATPPSASTGNNKYAELWGLGSSFPQIQATSPIITNNVGPTVNPLGHKEWALEDPMNRMGANSPQLYQEYLNGFKHGGSIELPKAQFGIPDWASLPTTSIFTDPSAMTNYLASMGTTDYASSMAAINDAKLKERQPDLGPTPLEQQQAAMFAMPTSYVPDLELRAESAEPSFEQPQVEITNKLAGNLNRLADSRFVEGYGKLSNLAVAGARQINEFFNEKKARDARGDLYAMTNADRIYGMYEDPVNKQGTWDTNTGLAEQDNRVTYMRAAHGGEMQSNELDLDPDTIAKLIAAGARLTIK